MFRQPDPESGKATEMMMRRVRVDFNRRGEGGRVVSSIRRADGDVAIGDRVAVFQPGEDDMKLYARVANLDPQSGRLELEVEWEESFVQVRPTAAPWWTVGFSSRVAGVFSTQPAHGVRRESGLMTV